MAATISGLQRRLAREESGFTLIELLIVLVIIGILLAVAVPSYLGFKDRANRRAAQANVRSAVPAVEAYYADHGNYAQLTLTTAAGTRRSAAARGIDAGVKITVVSAGSLDVLHQQHAGQLHVTTRTARPATSRRPPAPRPTRRSHDRGARSNPRPSSLWRSFRRAPAPKRPLTATHLG